MFIMIFKNKNIKRSFACVAFEIFYKKKAFDKINDIKNKKFNKNIEELTKKLSFFERYYLIICILNFFKIKLNYLKFFRILEFDHSKRISSRELLKIFVIF